jgi:hypothetical protein
MTTRTFMVTVEFEDECHCGGAMCGSDHCSVCGCEEFERTCEHRATDEEIKEIAMGGPHYGMRFS